MPKNNRVSKPYRDKRGELRDGAWAYKRRKYNAHLRRIQSAIDDLVIKCKGVDLATLFADKRFTAKERETLLVLAVAHYRILQHFRADHKIHKDSVAPALSKLLKFDGVENPKLDNPQLRKIMPTT